MDSLPQGLSQAIFELLSKYRLSAKRSQALHDDIARLLIRYNRQLRAEIFQLGRDLAGCADQEEADYGSSVGAYAGEETAHWIAKNIVKRQVYVDPDEEAMRRLVDEIFGSEDGEEDEG